MAYPKWHLSEDRYFGRDSIQRRVARELYESVAKLPIVSPHGHVDPRFFADENAAFGTSTELLIIPDYYIFRTLYSQGILLEALRIPRADGGPVGQDHRRIWQIFAENFHLFRGTATGSWLAHELYIVFGIKAKHLIAAILHYLTLVIDQILKGFPPGKLPPVEKVTLRDASEMEPYLKEPQSKGWKSIYELPRIGF